MKTCVLYDHISKHLADVSGAFGLLIAPERRKRTSKLLCEGRLSPNLWRNIRFLALSHLYIFSWNSDRYF